MKRRSALKYSTVLAGAGLSASFIAGVLSGCAPEKSQAGYMPLFFEQDKFSFLKSIAEVLIPQTETPGAADLELADWIDTIVQKCYTKEEQKQVSDRLNQVHQALDGEASLATIQVLESSMQSDQELETAYMGTKRIIATAYLANEYVGTKLLNYLPIPGEYEACIPLSETNGKAWTI